MILPPDTLQTVAVFGVLAKLQNSTCCRDLSAYEGTKNITLSAPFLLVFFTISVYHKWKCLFTFALIALMPLWHGALAESFISAMTLTWEQ